MSLFIFFMKFHKKRKQCVWSMHSFRNFAENFIAFPSVVAYLCDLTWRTVMEASSQYTANAEHVDSCVSTCNALSSNHRLRRKLIRRICCQSGKESTDSSGDVRHQRNMSLVTIIDPDSRHMNTKNEQTVWERAYELFLGH